MGDHFITVDTVNNLRLVDQANQTSVYYKIYGKFSLKLSKDKPAQYYKGDYL